MANLWLFNVYSLDWIQHPASVGSRHVTEREYRDIKCSGGCDKRKPLLQNVSRDERSECWCPLRVQLLSSYVNTDPLMAQP